MTRPNILMIMTDQQRWDTMACAGNAAIETPNLDWLASRGTLFERAYSATPSCIPARASLITGMDPWHTGILGMGRGQGPMGVGFRHTLPGELANAGYHTHAVGKLHHGPQRSLNGFQSAELDESGREIDPGFVSDYREWFDAHKDGDYGIVDHGIDWNSWMARPYHAPEHLHPSHWTVNRSIRFLEKRDPTRPFFLLTSFARPHSPYDAPEPYFTRYERSELPTATVGEWASVHDVAQDAVFPDAWRGKRSAQEIHRARAGYYGSITHIDHQVGRLLFKLRSLGLLDSTMIVFTSDHGDMLGDHNLWRKTYAYEGSAHIPLIVCPPAADGGSRRARAREPVTLQDIMPTILEGAGVPVPKTVDGRSLLPLCGAAAVPGQWREFVHGEHCECYSPEQEMQYLCDGRMKYIWFPQLDSEQLFDLETDPGETRDLAREPTRQAEVGRWRGRLAEVLAARDAGLTSADGTLLARAGEEPIVSPHYEERMRRTGIDWQTYVQPPVGRMTVHRPPDA